MYIYIYIYIYIHTYVGTVARRSVFVAGWRWRWIVRRTDAAPLLRHHVREKEDRAHVTAGARGARPRRAGVAHAVSTPLPSLLSNGLTRKLLPSRCARAHVVWALLLGTPPLLALRLWSEVPRSRSPRVERPLRVERSLLALRSRPPPLFPFVQPPYPSPSRKHRLPLPPFTLPRRARQCQAALHHLDRVDYLWRRAHRRRGDRCRAHVRGVLRAPFLPRARCLALSLSSRRARCLALSPFLLVARGVSRSLLFFSFRCTRCLALSLLFFSSRAVSRSLSFSSRFDARGVPLSLLFFSSRAVSRALSFSSRFVVHGVARSRRCFSFSWPRARAGVVVWRRARAE